MGTGEPEKSFVKDMKGLCFSKISLLEGPRGVVPLRRRLFLSQPVREHPPRQSHLGDKAAVLRSSRQSDVPL